MRLTLRTLLAYMDDILHPQDQQDLEKQIAESQRAAELIHRTRDVSRRLRLGAPPAIGEGLEVDPNVAAEYLESMLSPEVEADYEKVCLESDVNLAEIASCHHVLTMVLAQPAEVDAEMRSRIYEVAENPDQARAKLAAASAPDAAKASPDTKPSNDSVEVPQYLRENQPTLGKRLLVASVALLLVAATAFFLIGPDGLLRNKPPVIDNTPSDGDEPPIDDSTPPIDPVPDGDDEGNDPSTDNGGGSEDPTPPLPVDTTQPDAGGGTDPGLVGGPVGEGNPTPPVIVDLPVLDPGDDVELPTVGDPNVEPFDDGGAGGAPDAGDGGGPNVGGEVMAADPNEDGGAGEPPVEVVVPDGPLGTFVSVQQILLRYQPDTQQWQRLSKSSKVMPGDQLLALPTYRPEIAMMSGLRIELSNATRVQVLADARGPIFNLTYGRLLVSNSGAEPVSLTIIVDEAPQQLVLEPLASVAVDVQRQFMPGMAMGEVMSPSLEMVYAPGGKVTRVDANGVATPVEVSSQWQVTASGAGPISPMAEAPEWLSKQDLQFLEQRASRSIEQALDTQRGVKVQLLGFYDNTQRSEERDLAARCAMHTGEFQPFVSALADSAQRANWDEHIEMLREALASSPEQAEKVKQTIVAVRGQQVADDLYEMIRGYTREQLGASPQQLQNGRLLTLIDRLESDRLEVRVLAFHNLKQLTGKSLLYQPAGSPSARERSVRTWRERLQDNELIRE